MAKIIAETGGGLLVEMTKDEVANIMGHQSRWSVEYEAEKVGKKGEAMALFKPGAEIPVGEVWSRLNNICTSERTFLGIASEMRKCADWMETVPKIVAAVSTKKPAKKEDQQ